MKKSNLIRNMVAVLFLAAGATACSNENALIDDNKPQQPEAKTQIITVNFGGNDHQTRALDTDGHKTITVGEKIGVLYNYSDIDARYGFKTEADVINVDATGKIATISVTLTSADDNAKFAFVYPSTFSIYSSGHYLYSKSALMTYKLRTQDGTLATLSDELDYCKAEGTLIGTDLPDNITMENQLSICKFTLQDASNSSDITSAVTSFSVNDGTNGYIITRSAVAGPIYVAMLPVTTAAFSFTAGDGVNTYKKNVASATLQAGYIYNSTLSMTKQENTGNLGKVLGADGNIYETVAAAEAALTTAAGMIAYEGSETGVAGKTHGLCISLQEGAKLEYRNISYTGFPAPPDGASEWATPTVMQWMHMFEACGGDAVGSKGEDYHSSFGHGNITDMMRNCGGTEFNTSAYWTSSTRSVSGGYRRINYYFGGSGFNDGNIVSEDASTTTSWYYRGVFAW